MRGDGNGERGEPDLTEPEIIPCLYVSGFGIEINDSVVRLIGWVRIPSIGGEREERRIVLRCATSNIHARSFQAALRKGLAKGGN